MEWLLNKPIAHRGLHDINKGIPENSLPAFDEAAKQGYPIELDVRMIEDGTLVVFHDAHLYRMTGQRGRILQKSKKELKNLKLSDTPYHIPSLKEVLDLIGGRVPLLLEIKNRQRAGLLENHLVNCLKNYKGLYAVESFNPLSVRWFRLNAPYMKRGQLSGAIGGGKQLKKRALLRGALFYGMTKPDFIAYDIRYLPAKRVSRLKQLGYPVIGYTAKSHEEFSNALNYCTNVIFEGFIP